MNENLNLVEILKDCPKGMELDCTMYDNVTFDGIIENRLYPIKVGVGGVTTMTLTKYGQYTDNDFSKCIIFPKGETTWERFVLSHKFKDGDILSYQNKYLNNRTIYIYRYHKTNNTAFYVALGGNENETFYIDNEGELALNGYDETVCFATEEEKQKLFKAIKDKGYKWNAETKTLEKLIKPKFDPKTLEAFDKVLVRLTKDCIWNATFFSHYDKKVNWGCYPCVTTSCKSYDKCIPYNDETKHLLGTSDEAPEYYRYWED